MTHAPEPRPASRTALRVAALRALHQTIECPVVFVDPLAVRILGAGGPALLADYAADRGATQRLRATLALRSRVAEDAVGEAVARGVDQYVVLGAGLDTFAYRHGYPDLRVFEVDHAGTQAWKTALLAEAEIAIPPSVRHVGFDFDEGDLVAALTAAGFDMSRPAIFSMLGVVFYVPIERLMQTFGIVARGAAGSEIVFDYVPYLDGAPAPVRAIYERVAARLEIEGEPWITYFDPSALERALRDLGFTAVDDLDASALSRLYLADAPADFVPTALAHVVRAQTVSAHESGRKKRIAATTKDA